MNLTGAGSASHRRSAGGQPGLVAEGIQAAYVTAAHIRTLCRTALNYETRD
jgi:hypothetical protein